MGRALVLCGISLLLGCSDLEPLAPLDTDGSSSGGTFAGTTGMDPTTTGDPTSDPSVGSCSPTEQDCAAGQKCLPYSADGDATWNGTKCSEIGPEPKGLGETCLAPEGAVGGEDDCDVGLMCFNVPADGVEGTCVALCDAARSCEGQTVCSVYNDGVLPLCLPTCDPLGQDCGSNQVCIPQGAGDKFVCAYDASAEGGSYGDPCLAFNKCDAGLYCAPAAAVPGCVETTGCCSDFCDLSAPDPDTMCSGQSQGQTCNPWSASPAPGLETLGACSVPQ